jgi:hypothetical protein
LGSLTFLNLYRNRPRPSQNDSWPCLSTTAGSGGKKDRNSSPNRVFVCVFACAFVCSFQHLCSGQSYVCHKCVYVVYKRTKNIITFHNVRMICPILSTLSTTHDEHLHRLSIRVSHPPSSPCLCCCPFTVSASEWVSGILRWWFEAVGRCGPLREATCSSAWFHSVYLFALLVSWAEGFINSLHTTLFALILGIVDDLLQKTVCCLSPFVCLFFCFLFWLVRPECTFNASECSKKTSQLLHSCRGSRRIFKSTAT